MSLTNPSLRGTYEFIVEKLLERKVSSRRGYISYEKIARDIAIGLLSAGTLTKESAYRLAKEDSTQLLQIQIQSALHFSRDFPLFALTRDLMEALGDTDIPAGLEDLNVAIPCGVLLLPRRSVYTPGGGEVTEITFNHLEPGEIAQIMGRDSQGNAKRIIFPGEPEPLLRWGISSTENDQSVIYGSSTTLSRTSDRKELKQRNDDGRDIHHYPPNADIKKEREFVARITRIVVNFLVYMQIEKCPLSLEIVEATTPGVGFSASTPTREQRVRPRLIGEDFHIKYPPQYSHRAGGDGKRRSPIRHLRRGHFRTVGDKMVFVRPTYVSGG